MAAANPKRTARRVVFAMLAIGIVISTAGHHYQKRQQASQVTWQDVSATLQDVEVAKRDLFDSLNSKAGGS